MDKYILKIDCQDQKGLVYKTSKVLFENNLNITKNSEFVDKDNGKFFIRVEFSGECELSNIKSELQNTLPQDATIELMQHRKKNIIIMATKEAHALGDILIRHDSNELNANILAVISNHNILQPLVERFDIPYHFVPSDGLSRRDHEQMVEAQLNKYEIDFIVLAKYMRILTADFVQPHEGKIINIHHSFLPAFIGANPYKQAHERGVKIIGATAHFVNNNLDEGPIISQDVITVDHNYTWQNMQKAGRNVESTVLARSLDLAFDDRIFIYSNKTVIF
jgi:formyltetrahydrofolate deformylase